MMETGEVHLYSIKGKTGVEVEILSAGKTIGKAILELDKYDKKTIEGFEKIVKLIITR